MGDGGYGKIVSSFKINVFRLNFELFNVSQIS